MGDIHGRFEKYMRMLKEIGFRKSDDLYVLGDMIDKGSEPIKVIKDMSMRANVFPILGDSEYTALKIFKNAKRKGREDAAIKHEIDEWVKVGGGVTAAQFVALPNDEREALTEYIEELPLYEELTVNGKNFILVHAGLSNFKIDRPLDDYSPEELIFEKADINTRYFTNATLISGHRRIDDKDGTGQTKAIQKNGHLCINCGENEDDPLCAVCLDDGREFYV